MAIHRAASDAARAVVYYTIDVVSHIVLIEGVSHRDIHATMAGSLAVGE